MIEDLRLRHNSKRNAKISQTCQHLIDMLEVFYARKLLKS